MWLIQWCFHPFVCRNRVCLTSVRKLASKPSLPGFMCGKCTGSFSSKGTKSLPNIVCYHDLPPLYAFYNKVTFETLEENITFTLSAFYYSRYSALIRVNKLKNKFNFYWYQVLIVEPLVFDYLTNCAPKLGKL